MNDALLVCRFERVRDLLRNHQRFGQRNRPLRDAIGERRPVDELHHERTHAARLLEAVNVRDVRVVQRREQLRFAAETREALGIVRDRWQQDLDGDVAIQLRVVGPIDLAHAADAER